MLINVEVFDIVDFVRFNERTKISENYSAVWMLSMDSGRVYVYFGRIDTQFVQTVQIGQAYTVGCTVREVYPEDRQGKYPAPKGYDRCPERHVILRPQIGGYEIDKLAAKKAAKIEARKQSLGL